MSGQMLFLVAVAAWAGLEIYLHLFHGRRVRQGNAEKLSKYAMWAAFAFAGFGARLFTADFAEGFRHPFTAVRWLGTGLIYASIALRAAAVAQLGTAYSVNLGVPPGQPLITRGLYHRIRHPGYLSLCIGFLGVGLTFFHWLATPLCILLPASVIAWRIRLEERLLEEAYGEEYRTWARRTPRLLPFLV